MHILTNEVQFITPLKNIYIKIQMNNCTSIHLCIIYILMYLVLQNIKDTIY